MTSLRRISVTLLVLGMLLQVTPLVSAQMPNNAEINEKIRKEAVENSQIMNTLHYFSDVYGPRLTGTPQLENAGKWAMKQMKDWGFDRVDMEPWEFGSPGWTNDRATGHIVSPTKDSLVFEVQAWTPGTNGVITANAVQIKIPTTQNGDDPRCVRGPTQEELTAYFDSIKSLIRGNIVFVGEPGNPGIDFDPPAKRLSNEAIASRINPTRRINVDRPNCPELKVQPLGFRELFTQIGSLLLDNKAAMQVSDARREHGQIRAFGNRNADPATTLPTVIMRNEDYGRIWRLMAGGLPVVLEFDIKNTYYPEGKTAYNTIGEIAGTDKADEVIMLGGHLDSWHSATGATDNGIGCAVMMEAARIIKAIGVKPRRTIRVALWAGEEQGLLGSQAYVEKHFGSAEKPKPDYDKFGGYFNVDAGTGRVRGWSVFGPASAAGILNQALLPMYDLNFVGVTSTSSRGLGGSDHTSFNQAGLPGIGALQDPVEYFTHTWHTNLDTYERISEDDVKATAAIVAAGVYELAMRDELLPRFSKTEMPKAPSNGN